MTVSGVLRRGITSAEHLCSNVHGASRSLPVAVYAQSCGPRLRNMEGPQRLLSSHMSVR
ncbi:hypothetical protein FKP32DRAFT_84951 [Trametes sanguinea]|nr:hypothetical protein FKP32DRAFT_84951 [Trametes sanguinea]